MKISANETGDPTLCFNDFHVYILLVIHERLIDPIAFVRGTDIRLNSYKDFWLNFSSC